MNFLITVALFCCLSASVLAPPPPGGPHGGPPHGPHGGPPHGGPHGHKSLYDMFPACETMAESMRAKNRELKESGEIGHRNCKEEDPKVCKLRDMEKVRCAMTDEPSQECTDEILAYIQGDICNEDGAETDD
ncbi:hypothetical protein HNY73_018392 [Argiope bruennichi]|uniref:Uncharacterized protein n=1 Tax=Argiope bruennichi TaxID=94029 RepID=A0A8T0EG35_ARGBR|nr:hypothetical protein HNY73_018392 [Argiope bruennichi]